MPGQHARLAPSSASRWLKCPGSAALCARLPNRSGRAAAEGTVFHHFVALCLEQAKEPDEFIGHTREEPWFDTAADKEVVEAFVFDEEMANHALPGLQRFREFAERPGARLLVEQRVDIGWVLGEDAFGTVDVQIINESAMHLLVGDWKYGAAVPVSPKENAQALLYALGAWKTLPARMRLRPEKVTVSIVIEQPRHPAGGGRWDISGAELLQWVDRFREAAELSRQDPPVLIPGPDQCRFCDAMRYNTCKAFVQDVLSRFDATTDLLAAGPEAVEANIPCASALSDEEMVAVLKAAPTIRAWLDSLQENAVARLSAGERIPGLALKPGRRPPRRWVDADDAERVAREKLGDEAFEKRMLSLARLEKQMGAKAFEKVFGKLVLRPEPKMVLDFVEPGDEEPSPGQRLAEAAQP